MDTMPIDDNSLGFAAIPRKMLAVMQLFTLVGPFKVAMLRMVKDLVELFASLFSGKGPFGNLLQAQMKED